MLDALPVASHESLDADAEDARLAALRPYVALSPHEADQLSRLSCHAAQGFGATHAAVSFVGEATAWFGGAFGFTSADFVRAGSFCDAVVRSAAPLLVPDGAADPRFWRHPLVRGAPGLRCYAGVPLPDPGGHVLGTVSAYSTRPAAFGHGVLADLGALAGLVRDFLSESRPAGPSDDGSPALRVQGWLGVRTVPADERKRGRVAGLTVLSIAEGSPASLAGLRPTDILQSIGGRELLVSSDIVAAMAGRVLGSLVEVRFRRAGEWRRCQAEIVARRTRFSGRSAPDR